MQNFTIYEDFLDSSFKGLHFYDDIVSFSATLASTKPDSTIALRAAYNNSIVNSRFKKTNNNVMQQLLKAHCQTDLNHCRHYCTGMISVLYNESITFTNFKEAQNVCISGPNMYMSWAKAVMSFVNDDHVNDILRMYKQGKFSQVFKAICLNLN